MSETMTREQLQEIVDACESHSECNEDCDHRGDYDLASTALAALDRAEAAERELSEWQEQFAELLNIACECQSADGEDEENEASSRMLSWQVGPGARFIKAVAVCVDCDNPAVDGVRCIECGGQP